MCICMYDICFQVIFSLKGHDVHLQLQVELERLNQAIADIHLIDGDLFVSYLLFFIGTCLRGNFFSERPKQKTIKYKNLKHTH